MDIEVANSHEPSYYEIALTNRQVIVAFVILLVCLLSAFFSGIWIGRESEARAQEQLVRNTPPETQEAPVDDEGRELEEFQFFDSGNDAQQAAGTVETADDTTLVEDMSGDPTADDPVEQPVAAETPAAPEPEPSPEPRNRRDRRREREERAALETPAPAPARPEPASTPEPEPAAAGKVVIQVFSSPERDQAEKIRDRLVSGGQQAFLSPVEVGGNTMYRVRIGPFGSRDDAQKVAERVRKGFKLDTWITE